MHRLNQSLLLVILVIFMLGNGVAARAETTPNFSDNPGIVEDAIKEVCTNQIFVALRDICSNTLRDVLINGKDPAQVAEEQCTGIYRTGGLCKTVVPAIARAAEFYLGTGLIAVQEGASALNEADKKVDCAKDPFGCVMEGVRAELTKLVTLLMDSYVSVVTAKEQANFSSSAFTSVFADVRQLSALIVLLLLLLSFAKAAFLMSPRVAVRGVVGVAQWGILSAAGLTAATLMLKVSDEVSVLLLNEDDDARGTVARQFADIWVAVLTGTVKDGDTTVQIIPLPQVVSIGLLVIGVLLAISIGLQLAWLLFRTVAAYLIGLTLPILAAGLAGPETTQKWIWRGVASFVALAVAKPAMVLAMRLSLALMSEANSFADVLSGIMILFAAAFAPPVVYKLMAFMNFSGNGTVSGSSGFVGSSTASTVDMAKRIFHSNGSSASIGGSSGAAGALGPVGAAITGTLVAASTAKAASSWAFNNIATASGALGDNPGSQGATLPRLPGDHDQAGYQPSPASVGNQLAPARRTPTPPRNDAAQAPARTLGTK